MYSFPEQITKNILIIRKKLRCFSYYLECFLQTSWLGLCVVSDVKKAQFQSHVSSEKKKTNQEKLIQASVDVVFIQIIKKKSLTREIEHKQYLLFNWDLTGRLNARMEFPLHNRKSFLDKIQFTFHQSAFLIYSGHSGKESLIVSNSIYSK